MNGGGGRPAARSGQGRRSVLRRGMKDAAKSAPEQFREYFLPKTDALFGIVWADAVDRECVGHRTAVNAILDGLEITNSAAGFWARVLEAMGATSREDLEASYARGKLAEGSDLEQACERAKDLLRRRMASEHDYRRRLLWELFGMREAVALDATRTDVARPATNGHGYGSEVTNGNGSRS